MSELSSRSALVLLLAFAANARGQVCTPQAFPKPMLPPGAATGADYGAAVAMIADRCVVGAPNGNLGKGMIHVYALVDGAWTLESSFGAHDGVANDRFGESVAIDGERIYVGAPKQGSPVSKGAVYVYERVPVAGIQLWLLEEQLFDAAGVADDEFGAALAVDDGVLLVGSPGDDIQNGVQVGAVSVFERFGEEWSQTHRFGTPNPLQWEQFGSSIAIDGGVAVIGSPTYGGPNGIPAAHGRATIMRRVSQWNWVFEKSLDPVDSTAQRKFGASVTISGTRIVVGAPGAADAVGGHRGGAYVFEKPFGAGTWTQKGTLLPNSLDHGQDFGRGVTLALNQAWVAGNREVLCFAFGSGTWDFMTEVSVPFPDLGSGPSYSDLGPALASSGGLVLVGRAGDSALNSEAVFGFHACGGEWEVLGVGTQGSSGAPQLRGAGPLQDELADEIRLQNAKPSAPALALIRGGAPTAAPFAGGMLYAMPANLVLSLSIPGDGKLALTSVLPVGLSQVPFVMQFMIADPAAKKGFALSNGLRLKTGI